ncbi:MAG TPA: alpha-2-macroglobulin, partial [Alphaproteobacteria bacterium]|nr:alpha-2-macroglobulin [Alphaproteobacteria bacterium]
DRSLCLDGLAHERTYAVKLLAGLPGLDGSKLAGDYQESIAVAARQGAVGFRPGGYVLPRQGPQQLVLRTVNTDRVSVNIYRLNDRNLVPQLAEVGGSLYRWTADRLRERQGERVWTGTLETKGPRNRTVETGLPLDKTVGGIAPGVYAATAVPYREKVPGSDFEEYDDEYYDQPTQWFVVTDLGLTTFRGDDGLTVAVRSLADATPVAGAELRLYARNNKELGVVRTDAQGLARFFPGLLRGEGGNAPQALFAQGPAGDFVHLDMDEPALDLTDRGVSGRERPGPMDGFLYAERGIYRPGETAEVTVLLRDDRARPVGGLPLTVKLLRPDGREVKRLALADAGGGAYHASLPLPGAGPTGMWTVAAHLDPEGRPVGSTSFDVQDFVPPRLEVSLDSPAPTLDLSGGATVGLKADYLYGAPGAGLRGEGTAVIEAAAEPFPAFKDFRFGLEQESFEALQVPLAEFTTDEQGRAELAVAPEEVPQTTKPLSAAIEARIFDIDGRATRDRLTLPVAGERPFIGLRSRDGLQMEERRPATFEVVAVDGTGRAAAQDGLVWQLFREDVDYSWYREGGRWQYRTLVRDTLVTGGRLAAKAEGPATVEVPGGEWGRYRFEVATADGAAASSLRYRVGYAEGGGDADRPDMVALTLDRPHYLPGDRARVTIKPPFDAEVLVVVADSAVRRTEFHRIGRDGATIELGVDGDWTTGTYVMAMAYTPSGVQGRFLPRRAVGLAWLATDPAVSRLDVSLDAPAETLPERRVTVPVKVASAEGWAKTFVTLAAVDDGVLQLTDYKAPDAGAHYYGKRRLGVELRDLYGRLIDPSGAVPGAVRSGGDGDRQLAGLTKRSSRVVSLYSGILPVGAEGVVQVPLDIPDFQGRLRLMAVAWAGAKLGRAEATLLVRSPVVAEATLPRFLAPGDEAQTLVDLHNLTGPAGRYTATLTAEGAVTVKAGKLEFGDLAAGARKSLPVTLSGDSVGTAVLRLAVSGPEGTTLQRSWDLTVRPAQPYATQRFVGALKPGERFTAGADLAAGLRPETVSATLGVSTLPNFDVAGILSDLDRYPYGCAEQTTSRALPLLYVSDLARSLGLGDEGGLRQRVQGAVDRVLARYQGDDGGFSLWGGGGYDDEDPWLTAYVTDFLARAKASGFNVPQPALDRAQGWLTRWVERNRGTAKPDMVAYATAVLARGGTAGLPLVRAVAGGTEWSTAVGRSAVADALARLGDVPGSTAMLGGIDANSPLAALDDPYATPLRNAAVALALAAGNPAADADRVAKLSDRLGAQMSEARHLSTQEQAWLILAAHALVQRSGDIELAVDGKPLPAGKAPFSRKLDLAALQAGVTVESRGRGAATRVVTVTGIPTEPLPPESSGFTIERRFVDAAGQPVDLSTLKQGDTVHVVLEGRAANPGRPALVVDLLPAGLEIEPVRLFQPARYDENGEEVAADTTWFDNVGDQVHVENRDDRFVVGFTTAGDKGGRFKVSYVARATTPGRFILPAAQVEDMYRPSDFARAAPGSLTVAPR